MVTAKISTEPENGLEIYCLRLQNSYLKVIPEQGCKIIEVTLHSQQVIKVQGNYPDLQNDPLYQSCFLAPFPNRIAKGEYSFENQEYSLKINENDRGHALHGLFFNRPFRFIDKKEDMNQEEAVITFQNSLSKDEFQGYPFALQVEIQLTLGIKELKIQVSATNKDERKLPYGIGWHPYFLSKGKIDNSKLILPSTEIMEFSDRDKMQLIPTGNLIPFEEMKHNLLGATQLDTCFLNKESKSVVFENLEIFMDEKMKYLQIYTPDDRESIAIEPMSCAPDSFNNQLGLINLQPGQKVIHTFGVKLL